MREEYEFRLFPQYVSLVGAKPPLEELACSAILRGIVGDPQFLRVGELDHRLRMSGDGGAFAGWDIKRSYSNKEIERAQLFLLNVTFRHLSAEEHGTKYRQFGECEHEAEVLEHLSNTEFRVIRRQVSCSLSARQASPLRFPYRRLGRKKDIFRLWGGELVVSQHFVDLIDKGGFSGGAFSLTIDSGKASRSPSDQKREFSQLTMRSGPLQVSDHAVFGATPFDSERSGYQHCQAGTIVGLRPITPLSVAASSWDGSDLSRTEVYVGGRQGLFRPHQLLVISKRLLEALRDKKIEGFRFEIVELI